MSLKIISPDFENGEFIPTEFTCDGKNHMPHIKWHNVPEGTESLVLIIDDPDAPYKTWDHWILFNISPYLNKIENQNDLPADTGYIKNSWGNYQYGGPCPPYGTMHRYYFKLYALSKRLDLANDVNKSDLLAAMQDCIIDQCEIIGKYSRKIK